MRKRTFICVALLIFVFTGTAAAAMDLGFRLINETGVDIYSIYISPSNSREWEYDLLDDGEYLLDGYYLDIEFSKKQAAKARRWDIRVEDDRGNYLDFRDFDLAVIYEITLNDDQTATYKE